MKTVYILTNEAMPGIVKVGQTHKTPEVRAQELSRETGVASQYVVVYKAFVSNYENVEKTVHGRLKSAGKHYNKEFFRCEPTEAAKFIRQESDVKYEDAENIVHKMPGGQTYVGQLNDSGLPHGKGMMTSPDGNSYDGDWKDGKKHGKGVFTFGEGSQWKGDKYDGDYVDDKKTGKGVYTFADGRKYRSEWQNGSRTGSQNWI